MLFKNAKIYQLKGDISELDMLFVLMSGSYIQDCSGLEAKRVGWVNPIDHTNSDPAYEVMGCISICMATNKKILPPAVIRKSVDDRVAEIEKQEDRTVRRKEKTQIRDEVVIDMLPKAFQETKYTHAYIDKKRKIIVIDTASANDAETLLSLLRENLGSFKVRPTETNSLPSRIMTDWVRSFSTPTGLYMENEVSLISVGEGDKEKVNIKNIEMDNDEVATHINAGKIVEKLRLCWQENICATFDDSFTLRKIRFLDILQEEIADCEAETVEARFDADIAIMTRELGQMIDDLFKAFGGPAVVQEAKTSEPMTEALPGESVSGDGTGERLPTIDPLNVDFDDPLYSEAKELIVGGGAISISFIQRTLEIGYNRAARMIETMEYEGFITPPDRQGKRYLPGVVA